jgi:beta-lactam-binding protein with PASTA domain
LLFLLVLTALVSVFILRLNVRNVKIINVTNAQLKSSKSEVEDSLRLKEVLLGEVHHRVKQSQMVVSLILKRVAINKALLKILLKRRKVG